MRILLVTAFLPYPENRQGPTQLLFSLLRGIAAEAQVDVAYYGIENYSVVSEVFGRAARIIHSKEPHKLGFFRALSLFRTSIYEYAPPEGFDASSYDCVWLYPECMYSDWKRAHRKIVVTGMDCSFLLRLRSLFSESRLNFFKKVLLLSKSYGLESSISLSHCFHTIGLLDSIVFRRLNPRAKVLVTRHPLRDRIVPRVCEAPQNSLCVGVSGSYSPFYFGRKYDAFANSLARLSAHKRSSILGLSFLFVGMGWGHVAEKIKTAGFDVRHENFVEDYRKDFISVIDVQLVLLACGAGVKMKVVEALAHGKHVIGTKVAFDSIPNVFGCTVIRSASEAVKHLLLMHDEKIQGKKIRGSDAGGVISYFDEPVCCNDFNLGVFRYLGDSMPI